MEFKSYLVRRGGVKNLLIAFFLFTLTVAKAQTNFTMRVMAANITSGTHQRYETAGLNIFKGLKPDVVAIQEFNYASDNFGINTPEAIHEMVTNTFGPEFTYVRESGVSIPNGIISRWPIVATGPLDDPEVDDRGIAWAKIDLPGTNDLYVISVHLYGSGTATDRNVEAMTITNFIATNCPPGAWVIVGGDFNTANRSEACLTTFKKVLSDEPVPTDNAPSPDADTNEPRNKPYDYVLASFALTNHLKPVVIGTHTFPNGLVFDSQVYNQYASLAEVVPVSSGDSHVDGMQHMAVIKDFLIPVDTNSVSMTNAPFITEQPPDRIVSPGSNVTFSVTATGTAPLAYQWRLNETNISGAITNPFILNNAQLTNAGNYSVVITNSAGSIISSNALLIVSNMPPNITKQPASQTLLFGQNATFAVEADGTAPLNYQWRKGNTNIPGANLSTYTRNSIQTDDAGNYSVVITNIAGSVTSAPAMLTVLDTNLIVIAQWNFNSPTPDAKVGTGTNIPSVGTGTALLIGDTTATFATGDTDVDPAGNNDNSAWNTSTYPTQGTGNKTRGVQFNVSTVGKQNINISWSEQVSKTGSKYVRLQYSTNGTAFADYPAATSVTLATNFEAQTINLANFPTVNDNPNFAFRILAEWESTAITNNNNNYVPAYSTSTYGPAGTIRFDMITVAGITLITNLPPPLPALLTGSAFAGSQFQFSIAGSSGVDYVIQASTNLATSNWFSLFTNTSPFTFTETNLSSPQRFYRAVSAP